MVMNLANRILSEFGAFVFFHRASSILASLFQPKQNKTKTKKHTSKQTNKKQGGKKGMSIPVDFCINVHGEYYLREKEK